MKRIKQKKNIIKGEIDWMITLIPLAGVVALSVFFFFMHGGDSAVLRPCFLCRRNLIWY